MSTFQNTLSLISSGKLKVGIVGMGYVGLPLALRFAEKGSSAVGIEISPVKVEMLNAGQSYIKHISSQSIQEAQNSGRFYATTKFSEAANCDAIIICVPTPLGEHREPDLSYIRSTINSLEPYIKRGQLISLESTTYPGTTEEEFIPVLESKGLEIGTDIFLVFSPEREDPGNKHFSTQSIPKILGGHTPNCVEVGKAAYSIAVDKVVCVSSCKTAEMVKLLENIFRAVNIGLVNELKVVSDKMGIDIWEVIDAAKTKPFGFTAFYPGPGLGGHCIPIDPFYLTWKAHEFGIHTRFIELSGEINSQMPHWVVAKVTAALNMQGVAPSKSKIAVLGLAYKKNIDDARESPALEIIDLLRGMGASVDAFDPYVADSFPQKHGHGKIERIAPHPTEIEKYDCIVVATDHDSFDFKSILTQAKLIVDTRGVYRNPSKNVVKA